VFSDCVLGVTLTVAVTLVLDAAPDVTGMTTDELVWGTVMLAAATFEAMGCVVFADKELDEAV